MARYDRIARLEPPEREDAFPGWLTLRDLEGREREPELGRRARLRFLALRPVRRLLARGMDGAHLDSVDQQVESVQRELGQLPARDAERLCLTEYLREIGGRTPGSLADATVAVGEAAECSGHGYAAEEFFLTAQELAVACGLPERQMRALRCLGRLYRKREAWEAAWAALEEAASLAETVGDRPAWALATDGMALVRLRAGDADGARGLLTEVVRSGEQSGDGHTIGIGAAGLCALELSQGRTAEALQQGWRAIELLPPANEERSRVLLNLGAAFRRLGLRESATSCYRIVGQWSTWPELRTEAHVEHAVAVAEAGDGDGFRERRRALLEAEAEASPDPQLRALTALGLGHGAMLVGDMEDARHHLRDAIATARDARLTDILSRAETLLSGLERRANVEMDRLPDPPATARQIAARIESLSKELVASG